jgi:hypothetical protein
MSWSEKYKRSIDCENPKGFSQRAHCQSRKNSLKEQLKPYKTVEQIAKKHRMDVSDIQKQLDMGAPIEHEHTNNQKLAVEIALQHLDEIPDYYTRLKKMEASAKKAHKKFKDVKEATDGIKAKDYKGRLDKWFDDGGWVQTGGKYDGKPCAKQPGQKTKPYCRDPDDRAAMSKEERNKRAAKKRKEDPNPNRSGEAKMVTQESAGKKDACYKKVKSRYDVWPSAYASGALVKCRKVGAANWGTKTEETQMIRYCPKCEKDETRGECKYGPKYWDMFSIPSSLSSNQMKFSIAQVHPANESKDPDHEYSMARSELSTIISAAKRLRGKLKGEGNIEAWVQSKITKSADYLDAAADYVDSGEMDEQMMPPIDPEAHKRLQKTQKLYNKGTSSENPNEKEIFLKRTGPQLPLAKAKSTTQVAHYEPDLKTFQHFMEDWQKVNRKDKTDGLSQAAVNAYRKENPGSKLKTAVTEKNPSGKRADRRSNFCSRMSGMKDKLTSAKTARDPDSNINKALRRWNCN